MEKLRDYFWLHKLALRLCGVSLRRNDHIVYRVFSILAFCFYISITLQEIHMIVIYILDTNLIMLAALISVAASHILGIIKLFVLLKKRLLIIDTIERLQSGILVPNIQRGGKIEEILINECISMTYKQVAGYYASSIIVLLSGDIIALVSKFTNDDPELWEPPWIPLGLFEITTSFGYYVVYFYECITLTMFGCAVITADLLTIAIFTHVRSQFLILVNFIRNLIPADLDDVSKIPKNYLHMRTKEVVTYHQTLIELFQKLEAVFNIVILAVFLGNVLMLCFTTYLSTMNSLGDIETIRDGAYIVTVLTQVYFYCYYGNELTLCGESVSSACYDVNFVGADLSFQKDLIFIMGRSQKPMTLTIGKFSNLTISTFVVILRASYSYFMVIRSDN